MVGGTLDKRLLRRLARGEYVVDADAVAGAILEIVDDSAVLPFASGVLVAAKRHGLFFGVKQHRAAAGYDLA